MREVRKKRNLSPYHWKLEYWNKPKLSQVAYTSRTTANSYTHCMLDLLMSLSNNQVHIDEINESVNEKIQKSFTFIVFFLSIQNQASMHIVMNE